METGLDSPVKPVLVANMSRMLAAYKLRLAVRAKQLGAQGAIWEWKAISIDEEQRLLLAEDKRRIAPYPYPGLRSFDTEEGEIFFGRDKNVKEVQALLAQNRVVAVLGGSGSGKSSLLRAGLLPFLNTERRIPGRIGNWYKAEFRPRTRPLYEMSSALAEQLMLPLLRLKVPGLTQAMEIPSEIDVSGDDAAPWLRDMMHRRFTEAAKQGRETVLKTFVDILDRQLDRWDNIATSGRRLSEPSLFLLVDQLEEAFRPEVQPDERDALLNLIVDLHSNANDRRGGIFLALTMRSEELHRCAEHRGLSEVVIGSGYQLELLDPDDRTDRADLRLAIVQPARNVFEDWGLGECLKGRPDAPFSPGMPEWLLNGAARLSKELEHRPDQLPLLQHALQATWHSAMKRWSRGGLRAQELEIAPADLPGFQDGMGIPDLGECLNLRADDAALEAAERFAESSSATKEVGDQALRATFRSLARRDDNGNWARRFAGKQDIEVFLDAEANSPLAIMSKELRWQALQTALNSFLLRGYLNRGGARDYDISHEALIRNWRKFQLWLRDPGEVAYCLTRVLLEVEEPKTFADKSDGEKIRLIPQDVARRVAMVSPEGQLPTSWGQDQIEPVLQRSAIRARWGTSKSEALAEVVQLSKMADKARERQQQRDFRIQFAEEQEKKRARRLVVFSVLAAIAVTLGSLYYRYVEGIRAHQAQQTADMRRITALARDALWSDGPATAILVASQVQKKGLPELAETERLMLASLHQLREARILRGHKLMVNGASYSPDGDILVTSDPNSLYFWNAKDGAQIATIESSYLTLQNLKFEGPILGVQWNPGRNWIGVATRDRTLLFAPCSSDKLRGYFTTCADQRQDIVHLVGDPTERAGAARFAAAGNWMLTGSFGTTLKRWDLNSSLAAPQGEFGVTVAMANALAISSDKEAKTVAGGTSQSEVKLFNSNSGALLTTLTTDGASHGASHGNITAIAFNPTNPWMLAASSMDGNIFVWDDWSNKEKAGSPIRLKGAHGTAFQIGFSSDGSYLVSTSDDGAVRMWMTKAFATDPPSVLRGHKGPVWSIAVSPDGNRIASGSTDESIIFWNRYPAFRPQVARDTTDRLSPEDDAKATAADCAAGLQLPVDFGSPAACIRSPNDRIVVASSDGLVELFDKDQDAVIAVDSYRAAPDVADLRLDGDRLIVGTHSGAHVQWPFFDSLGAVIRFSLDNLPYEGASRLAMPKDVSCRINDRESGCVPESVPTFDGTALSGAK